MRTVLLTAGLLSLVLGAAASSSAAVSPSTTASSSTTMSSSAIAASSATAASSPTTAGPKVRRQGILTLAGNGTAYDLDSLAANWDPSRGAPWTFQNIEYVPPSKHDAAAVAFAYEPTTDVLMGTRGHWTYKDCADAKYDPSYGRGNPNNITGSALNVGHGICVITTNTYKSNKKPLKTDGGHYALLVVKARTATKLTLQVTVWQRPGDAVQVHVSGSELLNADGGRVILHGVDRSGGEWACMHGTGIWSGPMDQASVSVMASWDVNAVRVPLNEACWNGESYVNPADRGTAYRAAVQAYVQLLNRNGIIAILDLSFSDGRYTGSSRQCNSAQAACGKPMPDRKQALPFWTSVARTFKGNDAVIFDLYNEPFPEAAVGSEIGGWLCWRDGGSSCPGLGYQAVGMQSLVNAVRSVGANNVIMLGGIQWANDLTQWVKYMPVDPDHNLAASWHSYNFDACDTQSCWTEQLAPVIARVPVIAGEIGENNCSDSYIGPLMSWLDAKSTSYLAWAWNDEWSCVTGPSLITSYSGAPTAYGAGYRSHLQSRWPSSG
jgi:endoglucanase